MQISTQELGLLKIELEHKNTLLTACEAALAERDAKNIQTNAIYHLALIPDNRPCYDSALAFAILAPDEATARRLASTRAGDEGRKAWTNPKRSTCRKVSLTAPASIILRDFRAG